MDFDWLYDLELDYTAALIAVGAMFLFGIFLLGDPLGVGMSDVSLGGRVIGLLAGGIASYFIALRMINK